jgi:hypothetical protein
MSSQNASLTPGRSGLQHPASASPSLYCALLSASFAARASLQWSSRRRHRSRCSPMRVAPLRYPRLAARIGLIGEETADPHAFVFAAHLGSMKLSVTERAGGPSSNPVTRDTGDARDGKASSSCGVNGEQTGSEQSYHRVRAASEFTMTRRRSNLRRAIHSSKLPPS